MKVAIFSDNFYPELGGIQDSISSLGKELGRLGHQVQFYVPYASSHDYQVAGLPAHEANLGKNVGISRFYSFPYPSPTKQSRMVIPTSLRWLELKKFRPDIIHTQTFFGIGLEAIAAAKALDIPIIGTNHWAIAAFGRYSPFSLDVFRRRSLQYVSWYYNHCDFVTAPSESVFRDMIPYGFEKPHQAVSNPIETSNFTPANSLSEKQKLKRKYGFSDHTMIFAARLAVEKRIDVLIKTAAEIKKQIPDVTFAMAGHGAAEKELRQLAKKLNVTDNVKFLGTLPPEQLAEAYRASEVFTIASTSETQSMTLMQALACGLPAVGVNNGPLPEYITKAHGYIVEPENPKAMAEKVMYLFEHPKTRATMGKEASQYLQKFSPHAIGETWVRLYRRVIAEKRAPQPATTNRAKKMPVVLAEILFAAVIGLGLGAWLFTEANPTSAYAFTSQNMQYEKQVLVTKIKYTYHSLVNDNDADDQ